MEYKVLTQEYFSLCFMAFKHDLGNKKLTSTNYGLGENVQK